jgi:hypothetical protein
VTARTCCIVAVMLFGCASGATDAISSAALGNDEPTPIAVVLPATRRATQRTTESFILAPYDGSTAVGTSFPYVAFADARDELPEHEQVMLANGAHLTDEAGNDVRLTGHYVAPASAGPDRMHRMEFRPEVGLVPGWYRFEVEFAGRGRATVHYRPDSHPVVQEVVVTGWSDDATSLRLAMSELVLVESDAVRVSVGGSEVGCRLLGTRVPSAVLEMSCESSFRESGEITFADTVRTIQGTPLYGSDRLSPATVRVRPAERSMGETTIFSFGME